MSKLTLTDLASITNETSAITTINNNNDAIETALENTLSRDGTTPNSMSAQLDMNTHKIINLAEATGAGEALEYSQLQDRVDEIQELHDETETFKNQAESYKNSAESYASAAQGYANDASGALEDVQDLYDQFNNFYLGEHSVNPTLDNSGSALTTGDIYFNTSTNEARVWTGSEWINIAAVTALSTDTLKNKSIDLTDNTLTGTTAEFNTALSDDDFATLTNTVVLTNKSIDLTDNTITGTLAEFNTAISDANLVNITAATTVDNLAKFSDTNGNVIPTSLSEDSSGNVAITGDLTLENTNEIKMENSSGTPLRILDLDSGNALNIARDSSVGAINFFGPTRHYNQAITSNNFTIDDDGKVGIGVANPTASLHINASNPVVVYNTTDAASNRVANFGSFRATPTDLDNVYIDFSLSNDASEAATFGRITAFAIDVSDGAEAGLLRFSTTSAGAVSDAFDMIAGAFYPTTDNTNSIGLSNRFLSNLFTNQIELGNASDTSLTRSAAGKIAVEGVDIPTISSTDVFTNKSIDLSDNTLTGTYAELDTAITDVNLANQRAAAITFIIDGGTSTISTGIKGDISIPFDCTITQMRLLADQSGSIVVDIWKDNYTNFPPTDADSITASAVPTITSDVKTFDTTLSGWTTSISTGDILRFNVDSVTNIVRCTVVLYVIKS